MRGCGLVVRYVRIPLGLGIVKSCTNVVPALSETDQWEGEEVMRGSLQQMWVKGHQRLLDQVAVER